MIVSLSTKIVVNLLSLAIISTVTNSLNFLGLSLLLWSKTVDSSGYFQLRLSGSKRFLASAFDKFLVFCPLVKVNQLRLRIS